MEILDQLLGPLLDVAEAFVEPDDHALSAFLISASTAAGGLRAPQEARDLGQGGIADDAVVRRQAHLVPEEVLEAGMVDAVVRLTLAVVGVEELAPLAYDVR